jgi:hypothetical protein
MEVVVRGAIPNDDRSVAWRQMVDQRAVGALERDRRAGADTCVERRGGDSGAQQGDGDRRGEGGAQVHEPFYESAL